MQFQKLTLICESTDPSPQASTGVASNHKVQQ
uniref:Uncharacterized protein n=1 Tax=Arundo donax TaxID=35708 RepID=A0A0A8XQT5_ARUDO